MVEEFKTDSSVCGCHVYQGNWTPIIDEQLNCEREDENPGDRYAVTISNIIGHVPGSAHKTAVPPCWPPLLQYFLAVDLTNQKG